MGPELRRELFLMGPSRTELYLKGGVKTTGESNLGQYWHTYRTTSGPWWCGWWWLYNDARGELRPVAAAEGVASVLRVFIDELLGNELTTHGTNLTASTLM